MVRPVLNSMLSGDRKAIANYVESDRFVGIITALILINAVVLGLETEQAVVDRFGWLLGLIDFAILVVFTVEIALKFYAYRWDFFRSGWNVFDLFIVVIAWMPATDGLSILRALRILRVLRLLSVVPQMRRVISAIGHSIPGMVAVIGVLGLVFYISSVLTTKLFGTSSDPNMQEWFGSLGASAYTLFQIMTLESWSMGIVRPTMELFPYAWIFFVPFIIVTSFAVLNLFIGIIVDAMQTLPTGGDDEKAKVEEGGHRGGGQKDGLEKDEILKDEILKDEILKDEIQKARLAETDGASQLSGTTHVLIEKADLDALHARFDALTSELESLKAAVTK